MLASAVQQVAQREFGRPLHVPADPQAPGIRVRPNRLGLMELEELAGGCDGGSQPAQIETFDMRVIGLSDHLKLWAIVAKRDDLVIGSKRHRGNRDAGAVCEELAPAV